MDSTEFAASVLLNLPFKANEQQVAVVAAMARFCAPGARQDAVFILNGYAGTGKTSITGALVRSLKAVGLKAVLLAQPRYSHHSPLTPPPPYTAAFTATAPPASIPREPPCRPPTTPATLCS